MSGTANSNVVSVATGTAENRMNGRNLPHRVRVMSMRLPTIGSPTASTMRTTAITVVAIAICAGPKPAYCSR